MEFFNNSISHKPMKKVIYGKMCLDKDLEGIKVQSRRRSKIRVYGPLCSGMFDIFKDFAHPSSCKAMSRTATAGPEQKRIAQNGPCMPRFTQRIAINSLYCSSAIVLVP